MLLTCQTSRVNGTAIGLFSSSIKKCPRHLIDRRPLTEGVNLATAGWSQGQGGQAETIESNVRWLRQPRRLEDEPPLPSTRSLTTVMKITDPLPLDQIAYRSAEAKNQPKTSAARTTRGRQPGKQRTSLACHSNLSIAGIDFHHLLPPQALIGPSCDVPVGRILFFSSSGRNECSQPHCRHFLFVLILMVPRALVCPCIGVAALPRVVRMMNPRLICCANPSRSPWQLEFRLYKMGRKSLDVSRLNPSIRADVFRKAN
jgi:hypothetical protein